MQLSQILDGSKSDHDLHQRIECYVDSFFREEKEELPEPPSVIYLGSLGGDDD